MRNIKILLALVLLGFPVMGQEGRGDVQGTPVKLPLQVQPERILPLEGDLVKKLPGLEDFVGKWTGKWDNIFYVQFTISPIPGNNESLSVVYEWEERVGHELNRRVSSGKIEGNVLRAEGGSGPIDILLHAGDENRAQSYGHFINPRRANLTRQKAKE